MLPVGKEGVGYLKETVKDALPELVKDTFSIEESGDNIMVMHGYYF